MSRKVLTDTAKANDGFASKKTSALVGKMLIEKGE